METSLENIWEQDYNNVQWPTDISSPATAWGLNMTWLFFFRGADVNKNANSDDIEMKANLVDNKGDPNYVEETGPWNVLKILCMRYTLPKYLKILS